MTVKTVLGIDIGAAGAIALLTEDGELIAVEDMPILRDGPANRPTVNAPLLADILSRFHPSRAFIEFVGARPGEGPAGAFAFGRSLETLRHALDRRDVGPLAAALALIDTLPRAAP